MRDFFPSQTCKWPNHIPHQVIHCLTFCVSFSVSLSHSVGFSDLGVTFFYISDGSVSSFEVFENITPLLKAERKAARNS